MTSIEISVRPEANKTADRRTVRGWRTSTVLSLAVLLTLQIHLLAQSGDKPTSPEPKQENCDDLPRIVRERLRLKSPVNDKLLYGLEKDYVELLKTASNPQALLEAERLLETTNDNSHWTNYSAATRILRAKREKAAIPLLLRYIVLHAERSAHHVMIPEYAKTISVISGHKLDNPYKSGPDAPKRMRAKVGKIVETWWSKQKDVIETKVDKLSSAQLQTIVDDVLNTIRRSSRFSGSGGSTETAYGAYHRVLYGLSSSSSSHREPKLSTMHPDMVAIILEHSGYDASPKHSKSKKQQRLAYEAVPVLASLAKNGHRGAITAIAADKKQNSTVRMLCILSLYQAGGTFQTNDMLELLKDETHLEHRLVMLSTLRFGDKKAIPVLLRNMDDPNIEIATAAACALRVARPLEAIPKLEKLIRRSSSRPPLQLLGTLAGYKNPACRKILASLLEESLKGGAQTFELFRILSAFEDACGQRWRRTGIRTAQCQEAARTALIWYRKHVSDTERQLRALALQVDSAKTQLEVALAIEVLRHKEYKRLLALQGDFIVTAEQSKAARQHLLDIQDEVKTARAAFNKIEVSLETLKAGQ